mmetsp:Transcript_16551/g.30114  ORF Transcript_16551/g.30114 Transcript_16551/m.30114 type:complete len:127 (-) Transcript_16551:644-1024(-)
MDALDTIQCCSRSSTTNTDMSLLFYIHNRRFHDHAILRSVDTNDDRDRCESSDTIRSSSGDGLHDVLVLLRDSSASRTTTRTMECERDLAWNEWRILFGMVLYMFAPCRIGVTMEHCMASSRGLEL